MHRGKRWTTTSIAATCVVVVVALLAGCQGTERQEAGERPPSPRDPIKRIPDLVGTDYERAKTSFLQAGGEVVKRKPELSAEQAGTVIAQQPPAGERFTHAIELVVARSQKPRK